jgi:hypothetical protein
MVCEGIFQLYLLEEEEKFLINIVGGVVGELNVLFFPGLKFADGVVYLYWLEFSCHHNIQVVDVG